MIIALTIVHVIVCVFLVIVVLLQSGKAADIAGAFGGMGSQTAFGPRGAATVLSKATTIAAGLFMVTSLSLAISATRSAGRSTSVLERTTAPAKKGTTAQQPPAAPAAGGQVDGGQPTVTIFDPATGKEISKQPLDIDKLPKVNPNAPPPAQQQQPAPQQK